MNLQSQLLNEWNDTHGPPYALREHDLAWNLSQQDLVDYELTKIENTPVLLARASKMGVAAGLPEKNMWLSLWGKIGDERAFVKQLLQIKKENSKAKLFIGGDEFHLIPSLPLSAAGKKLQCALQGAGFQGSEAA